MRIDDQDLIVREATYEEERSVMLATWIASARQLRHMKLSVFNEFYPQFATALLLAGKNCVVTSKGKETVHAWACGAAPNVLHYAYVPHKLRGVGLGRAVIEAALGGYPKTIFVTASRLAKPHHGRFVYNPLLLRYG